MLQAMKKVKYDKIKGIQKQRWGWFAILLFFISLKKFFNVYLFLRAQERDRVQMGKEQRKRGIHRIGSRLQVLSCQHGARCGARTHEPWDHDLSRSRTLSLTDWATQAPHYFFKCLFIYFERKCVHKWGGGGAEREPLAGSTLSVDPTQGSDPRPWDHGLSRNQESDT